MTVSPSRGRGRARPGPAGRRRPFLAATDRPRCADRHHVALQPVRRLRRARPLCLASKRCWSGRCSIVFTDSLRGRKAAIVLIPGREEAGEPVRNDAGNGGARGRPSSASPTHARSLLRQNPGVRPGSNPVTGMRDGALLLPRGTPSEGKRHVPDLAPPDASRHRPFRRRAARRLRQDDDHHRHALPAQPRRPRSRQPVDHVGHERAPPPP